MKTLIFCLRNKGNNLNLNIYAKVERPKRKLTKINTIEYVIKTYQVKITKVNFTDVWLKGLKIFTTHRTDVGIANNYEAQIITF